MLTRRLPPVIATGLRPTVWRRSLTKRGLYYAAPQSGCTPAAISAYDAVDRCAGRPAKGRRWKSGPSNINQQ